MQSKAGLILGVRRRSWVQVPWQGKVLRAMSDPMDLGVEFILGMAGDPRRALRLFDERSRMAVAIKDPEFRYFMKLIEAYLDAVGIGMERWFHLVRALEHAELLEVDLLRIGVDVVDWLSPEGSLTSRRVALLVADFRERPETRLGADAMDIYPIDKAGIAAAQQVAQMSTSSEPHVFLRSPDDIAKENKRREEKAAAIERVKAQKPKFLESRAVAVSDGDFDAAKSDALARLAELKGDSAM